MRWSAILNKYRIVDVLSRADDRQTLFCSIARDRLVLIVLSRRNRSTIPLCSHTALHRYTCRLWLFRKDRGILFCPTLTIVTADKAPRETLPGHSKWCCGGVQAIPFDKVSELTPNSQGVMQSSRAWSFYTFYLSSFLTQTSRKSTFPNSLKR